MFRLLVFPLVAIIAVLLSLVVACADILLLEQYKIHPHWLMECNNLHQCSAIGYPQLEENEEQEWYTQIKWHNDEKNEDNFLLSFAQYLEHQSIKFCYENDICDDISGKIVEKQHISRRINYLEAEILFSQLQKYKYIKFHSEQKITNLDLNRFLKNYSTISAKYKFDFHSNHPFYNWKKFRYIKTDEINKLYHEISTNDTCSESLILQYENGDNILSLCKDIGIKSFYNLYRDRGNGYQPFQLLAQETEDKISQTGYGLVEGESMTGFFINPHDQSVIHVANLSGLWSCDLDYKLAYDGEKSVPESINIMPFCSNIALEDWISIYQRP